MNRRPRAMRYCKQTEATAAPSLDQVRAMFPAVRQPPSDYFDLENQKGSSKFPPFEAPEFYDPFVRHFDERAQTAAAQARLDARKGRHERARRYEDLAKRWREASRVALMRKQRALLEAAPAQTAVVCVWCTPHHTIREGQLPASHGMCPEAGARELAKLDAVEEARAHV